MKIIVMNDVELLEKLASLKKQGFDQIKLPGGTSKDRKHYSGVVIVYYDPETRKTFVCGLPYNSQFHKTEKENGSKKEDNETPALTAHREVVEETGLFIELKDLKELDGAKKEILDKADKTTVVHTKHFFVAKNFSGEIPTFEGPNLIDGETAAPLWIPVRLFKTELWKGHHEAFNKALQILSTDREICNSIMDLLV